MPVEKIDVPKTRTVRVLKPFYVRGKLTRVGDVVELDPIDAYDLTLRELAEPISAD